MRKAQAPEPGPESRTGPQVIDGQAHVEMDIVERLGEVAGLSFMGVAMQQHDGDFTGAAQEIQQEHRVGAVKFAIPVAEADVNLQWLSNRNASCNPNRSTTRSVSRASPLSATG